jgi:GT2 family glycosyltransferase
MSGVTVVVPNWNCRHHLARLLESVRRQTHTVEEVIVADNGSADGSPEAAEAAGARVIRLGANTGFCPAVNSGIRRARTSWVAVINNDVELTPGWLERLLEAARPDDTWFATGKLLSTRRRDCLDGTFDTICRGACAWRAGQGRPDTPEWDAPRPIRLAPFTASLFRRELFERVGLLDERFESYLEDVDFGLRCAKRGYGGIYTPRAVAYHAGSATLGAWHPETVRRMARNQVLLVAKHFPNGWLRRYGWPVVVAQSLWGMLAARHGALVPFVRGKLEGLRQFRAVRAASRPAEEGDVRGIVEESERDLLALQKQTGFDLYWRLYFALT